MGTARKLLLGAATAWQLAYLAVFLGPFYRFVASGLTLSPAEEPALPAGFGPLLLLHLGTALLMLVVAGWYVADAARSPRIPDRWRPMWIALDVATGPLAQMVHWVLFVWREGAVAEPAAAPPAGSARGS